MAIAAHLLLQQCEDSGNKPLVTCSLSAAIFLPMFGFATPPPVRSGLPPNGIAADAGAARLAPNQHT